MTKNENIDSTHSVDVLIIGGGSAGLRAAIEAHDAGANVLIISKSKRGNPHTVLARGGINAALGTMDPEDNWMIHAADTLKEGEFLADYERVEILCKSAPDAINELVNWGARFHREKEDGKLTQRFFGAHTYRRTVFYEDWTGDEIVRVLMNQVDQRRIKIMDDIYITQLLIKSDRDEEEEEEPSSKEISGAIGTDLKKRKIVLFECKSIILATGGYTRIYSTSSSRIFENYGEGIFLAYQSGVELVDMEMVQFHPTGMVWPEKASGTLATEAIRGEGGILLNSSNERFMKNYYPERMELGPRDVVARAIYNEILKGRGTEHGGVWLDVTHLSKEKILDRLPTMYEQFKSIDGIDISKEKMEVGPTAHYSMGGIVVDTKCRTKINGLFAAGEAISQIHGANRLGGNSLLDTMVFGKIAGSEAARLAKEITDDISLKVNSLPSSLSLNENTPKEFKDEIFMVKEPLVFRNKIQDLMEQYVGIIRDNARLQKGLKQLLELNEAFYSEDNILREFQIEDDKYDIENIILTLEVKSSLIVCETIVRSALMRQESRGAHFRSDFPNADNEKWMQNIYCRKNDESEMVLFTGSVKVIEGPLKDLLKSHLKPKHQREFE
ncbi:MAG: FAD-binding protein [Candidatus Nitrosocosmicus sp.]|nr:FAD-binding protein [Candidatus Nitrosocosmicus sp.]MDN5868019.1 FAD-binding protein [Candidatus Nitrosocosmicus sp.]